MRSPVNSPFSPGSDAVPQVWAGRNAQLNDWRTVLQPRRTAGVAERGRTILGEAGTGKSVLVRRIAAEAAEAGSWVTQQIRVPLGADPIKLVAAQLLDIAEAAGLAASSERRIGQMLSRVESVAVSGVSLKVRQQEGPEAYRSLTDLLVEIGCQAMREPGRMVLVHLDEVQNIKDEVVRSQLLIALGDALTHEESAQAPGGVSFQRALPIAVYLTGLPEFSEMAGTRTGATFARRFQTNTLQAIDDDALIVALQEFVTQGWEVVAEDNSHGRVFMEPEAQRAIVELAHGEPFLFQLAGERAWFAGSGPVITAAEVRAGWASAAGEAEAHVVRLLERLPERERDFLETMSSLEASERMLTNISRAMGLSRPESAGPTSRRLDIQRGIIERGKPYRFRNRAIEAYLTSSWPRLP
ncbi:Uncharacterised protein [Actinomyces bovis]|uniref:Orc1-like AAA ATPase domain-containing protein n=1 Tax=Actinomyces bovis TaxID=1658 RepID=A0ABY1VPW5_9ACTO|nr:ATP-binding protein [Actinomyces bovis]SPT53676.1 Uncharacterised protein [Actinomyces bovis]VEG55782.1 Uncharacterised protein [Actinomyces israelii]